MASSTTSVRPRISSAPGALGRNNRIATPTPNTAAATLALLSDGWSSAQRPVVLPPVRGWEGLVQGGCQSLGPPAKGASQPLAGMSGAHASLHLNDRAGTIARAAETAATTGVAGLLSLVGVVLGIRLVKHAAGARRELSTLGRTVNGYQRFLGGLGTDALAPRRALMQRYRRELVWAKHEQVFDIAAGTTGALTSGAALASTANRIMHQAVGAPLFGLAGSATLGIGLLLGTCAYGAAFWAKSVADLGRVLAVSRFHGASTPYTRAFNRYVRGKTIFRFLQSANWGAYTALNVSAMGTAVGITLTTGGTTLPLALGGLTGMLTVSSLTAPLLDWFFLNHYGTRYGGIDLAYLTDVNRRAARYDVLRAQKRHVHEATARALPRRMQAHAKVRKGSLWCLRRLPASLRQRYMTRWICRHPDAARAQAHALMVSWSRNEIHYLETKLRDVLDDIHRFESVSGATALAREVHIADEWAAYRRLQARYAGLRRVVERLDEDLAPKETLQLAWLEESGAYAHLLTKSERAKAADLSWRQERLQRMWTRALGGGLENLLHEQRLSLMSLEETMRRRF